MSTVERWWDDVDWWTDPRLAYARGLADGLAASRDERDAADDAFHRAAVRQALRTVERIDRRAEADRIGPRPDNFPGERAA